MIEEREKILKRLTRLLTVRFEVVSCGGEDVYFISACV